MAFSINNLVDDLIIECPITYKRLTITPLRLKTESHLEYQLLDEAVEKGLVTVEEASEQGSVPQMKVTNKSKQFVFIPDGSMLVGGKQNRVVNLSLMLNAKSETIIPVSCIEGGRWSYASKFFTPDEFCDSSLRAQMCVGTSASLQKQKQV